MAGGGSGGAGAFTVTSPDFTMMAGCSEDMAMSCDTFPPEMASYMSGDNVSPALSWTGAPSGTMSFAVVLQDLSNGFAHWVIWNIDGAATGLPADIDKSTANPAMPAGSQQCGLGSGTNDNGYYGPGSACNVYQFVVYALSMDTFAPTQATNQTMVRTQLEGLGAAILGTASITGRQDACASGQMCDYGGAMPACSN
jgi:hypothetical protein